MILVRIIFQAKFGKANELVSLLKEGRQHMDMPVIQRILTDLSGPFDMVVVEIEAQSLAEWEQVRAAGFASPEFHNAFGRTTELIQAGHSEYYTIEA